MGSWRGGEPAGEAKRSWRKKGNAASTGAGGKYWATGRGSKPVVAGNMLRLFVALVALLATTAGMVIYLLNTHYSTPLISLITVDYKHPWAPNAWAVEDQQRLQALNERTQFKVAAKQQRVGEGTWDQLIDLELEKISHGGPGGSLIPSIWGYHTLIIHLSTHGVLNADGQPCLLFADAEPLNEQTWVPLADVLRRIGENSTVKNGKDVRVLVVLDTGKQPPDIRCGLLCSGFAEAASQAIQSLPFANFAVLLSCDEDQSAWTAPEMGGSVFGVMVTSGLQGHADKLAGNSNGRVTVKELAKFVESTVDGYVREYRGRVQNPKLVWCGENQENDFELCHRQEYPTSAASTYQSNSRLEAINGAWQKFEEWSKRTPSYAAWQRATASNRLARAEQLLWAGAGYQTQFNFELDAASKIANSRIVSDWPTAICGGSLAFLDRVRGVNTDLVLETEGLDLRSLPAPKPNDSSAENKPARSPATPPTATEAGSAQAAPAPTPAAETAPPSAATAADLPANESPSLAGQIIAWLTFDAQAAAGAPPPERPGLPDRSLAVTLLIRWLAHNPQQVNSRVTARVVDWLGPIVDGPSVSREEALLRTINDHLQLTSSWNLSTINDLARLWSQYLQTAIDSEFALALIDPRATQAFEREVAALLRNLQLVRDHIHGCETQRDASDCANEIQALQSEIKKVLGIRDRLEKGWKLRDELALELPTLAQWITSPIGRSQSQLSSAGAWELAGQLNQRLRLLQTELADGKIPELVALAAIEGELEQLVAAYSQSMHDLMEIEAKGQRRSLGNLMLSLGLRPNVFRGLPLGDRAELHRGLNARYSDLVDVFNDEKLQQYCQRQHTEGIDEEPIWRIADLPKDITTNYSPLLFTEAATARPLESVQATGTSERGKWNALGGELRRLWSELPNQLVKSCLASVQSMSSQDAAAIREAEEQLMSTEYHAHLIAQLLPSDSLNVTPLPTILTHQVCDELFAIWQARRALNDFWKTPAMPQASMFMSASALDWLRAVPHPATGPVKLFNQSQTAEHERAVGWQDVIRQVTSVQDADDAWQAELSVKNFPAGSAWLRLELGGNSSAVQPLQNRRYQTRQETGSQVEVPTGVTLLTGKLPEGNHELVAWFRGHASSESIAVYKKQPPVILAWQAEEVGTTTIRVDAEPKPARIVFVLDCSHSMGSNLQNAKATLLDAIRNISKLHAGKTEIAVVVFGHTAEYNEKGSQAPDIRSNWANRPGQASLPNRPFNDVEVIQDLTPPSEQVISQLQNNLALINSFGRTPLYESIIQSINLLLRQNDGFLGDQRVVVITDGEDNPFITKKRDVALNRTRTGNYLVPNNYVHSEQAPVELAKGLVSLDFVCFNFNAGVQAMDTLKNMARDTKGKCYEADNTDLAEQLRDSIARHTFSTTALKTKRTVGSQVRLNDEQVIPGNQLPGEFEVLIDDTADKNTVALLGGESIELQYSNREGLTYVPKKGDRHPQIGTFSYNGHPYQAWMLTGVPDSIPQVRICLQSQAPKYQSLRPDVWLLELQSTKPGQAGEGERLVWTCDALWENYHNSPVLRVNIKNLPELRNNRLECRLWLRNRSNPQPTQRLPIAGLKKTVLAPGVEVSTETEIESGGLRLTVTEKREPDAPLVHWQVFPAPDKFVEHHVSGSRVSHQYFYSDRTVLSKLELAATPLPAAVNHEWEATQWIPVPKWKK